VTANKLAIVLGTSYPNPNLSHFSSMAIWQSGSPIEEISMVGSAATSIRSRGPFRAIGVGSTLTPLLAGDTGSVQWCRSRLAGPNGSLPPIGTARRLLHSGLRADRDAAGSIGDLFSLSSTLTPVLQNARRRPRRRSPTIDVVANMITANVPTRCTPCRSVV